MSLIVLFKQVLDRYDGLVYIFCRFVGMDDLVIDSLVYLCLHLLHELVEGVLHLLVVEIREIAHDALFQ